MIRLASRKPSPLRTRAAYLPIRVPVNQCLDLTFYSLANCKFLPFETLSASENHRYDKKDVDTSRWNLLHIDSNYCRGAAKGTFYIETVLASVKRRHDLPPLRYRLLPKLPLIPLLSHRGSHRQISRHKDECGKHRLVYNSTCWS